jgi:hypothetical protein
MLSVRKGCELISPERNNASTGLVMRSNLGKPKASKLLKHVVNDMPFFSGISPCSRPRNLVIRSNTVPLDCWQTG